MQPDSPDIARAKLNLLYRTTFGDPDYGKRVLADLRTWAPEAAAEIERRMEASRDDLRARVLLGPERYLGGVRRCRP